MKISCAFLAEAVAFADAFVVAVGFLGGDSIGSDLITGTSSSWAIERSSVMMLSFGSWIEAFLFPFVGTATWNVESKCGDADTGGVGIEGVGGTDTGTDTKVSLLTFAGSVFICIGSVGGCGVAATISFSGVGG